MTLAVGRRHARALFLPLIAAIAALLIAGCAAPLNVPRAGFSETAGANDGVVVVKVLAVQRISFDNKLRVLEVADENGIVTTLTDSAPSAANYSLFSKSLLPGKYTLRGFQNSGTAAGQLAGAIGVIIARAATSGSQRVGAQAGSFTVRTGELTNLGVVVTAIADAKDDKLKAMLVDDDRAQRSVLDSFDATAQERLSRLPAHSWDQAAAAGSIDRVAGFVRTRATQLAGPEVDRDGHVWIGTTLGFVHERDAQDKWTTHWTGSFDTITCVRALTDGTIFAGTDTGRYFVRGPQAQAWQAGQLTEGERIVQMEPMGGAGYAFHLQSDITALGQARKNRLVFKRDLSTPEAPKELVNVTGNGSAMGRSVLYFNGKELMFQTNPSGIVRTGDLHRVDPASLQVKREQVNHWARAYYPLSDGALARQRFNGVTSYTDISTDGGRTWTEGPMGGPNFPRFADRSTGYGTVSLGAGVSTVTVNVSKTTDGGATWTPVGPKIEAGGGITQIRFAGSEVLVYTGLQLVASKDGGTTWSTQWPLLQD